MQVHRVVLTVIDFDELGADGIVETLEETCYPNRSMNPRVSTIETRDIGAWSDDHPLNKYETEEAELARLFGSVATQAKGQ